MMKKILGLIIVATVIFSLVACGKNKDKVLTTVDHSQQDSVYQNVKEKNPLFSDDGSCYKLFQTYEQYGISYNKDTDEMYYNDKVVREFYDEESGLFIARTVGSGFYKNSIDVLAVYENGQLIGLREATEAEYSERTANREQVSKTNE